MRHSTYFAAALSLGSAAAQSSSAPAEYETPAGYGYPALTLPFTLPSITLPGFATSILPTRAASSGAASPSRAVSSRAVSSGAASGSKPASSGVASGTKASSQPASSGGASSIKPISSSRPSSKPASSGRASSSRPSGSASRSVKPSSASSSSTSVPTDVGKPVDTTSGQIVGHLAPNTTGVSEYLGIPFAQPPLGDLRFAPPVAYVGNGTFEASGFAPDCSCNTQNVPVALGPRLYGLLGDLGQVNDTLSEDCLYLNVWSKPGSGPAKKPVLVWIYGGGFNFGGTNVKAYNGRHFADEKDVVFVSINYRTNIMGFPGAPNITQNAGLLDQRLALEWVRDNIAGFGGDASRITIFGQSAGGASVDLYSFAWYEDPIVAGTIPMSGTSNSFGSRTPDGALAAWNNVTATVGCGNSTTSTPEAVLACMRSADITTAAIQAAAAPDKGLNSLLGKFGPTIDEKVVFANYTQQAVDGKFSKVPTLTGNTNYESGLFILIAAGAGEAYPQSTWDYINEQVFTCPVSRAARLRADRGVPTWRYYYGAMYPNIILPTNNITQAYHIAEIPIIFGTAEEITGVANTAEETALGDYLRGVWADFATDPANALGSKYGWPQYSNYKTNSSNLVLLGQNNATTAVYGLSSDIEGGCAFF